MFIFGNRRQHRSSTTVNQPNVNMRSYPKQPHWGGPHHRLSLLTTILEYPGRASLRAKDSHGSSPKWPWAMRASCLALRSHGSPVITLIGIACSIFVALPIHSLATVTVFIIPLCSMIVLYWG